MKIKNIFSGTNFKELRTVLHGCELPPDQQAIIEDNWNCFMNLFKNYKVFVSESFIDLFNKMVDSTLKLDDFLTFYFSFAVLPRGLLKGTTIITHLSRRSSSLEIIPRTLEQI